MDDQRFKTTVITFAVSFAVGLVTSSLVMYLWYMICR